MNREELLAGTRPDIRNKVIMTGVEGFDGYEIMEYKGMVWGISVRAKDMGQDCAMGCKQVTGGELTSYSELGDESRQRAIDTMLRMARR
ncbi:MAG: YbjQ family protein, partial [Verrucomicrobiales bacterium]